MTAVGGGVCVGVGVTNDVLFLPLDANPIHGFFLLVFSRAQGLFFHVVVFKSSRNRKKCLLHSLFSGHFLVFFRRKYLFPNHGLFFHVEESPVFRTPWDSLYPPHTWQGGKRLIYSDDDFKKRNWTFIAQPFLFSSELPEVYMSLL